MGQFHEGSDGSFQIGGINRPDDGAAVIVFRGEIVRATETNFAHDLGAFCSILLVPFRATRPLPLLPRFAILATPDGGATEAGWFSGRV